MPIRRVLCAILFAVGYLGSMEAQEAPIPQLSPGSARKPAPASRLRLRPLLRSPLRSLCPGARHCK